MEAENEKIEPTVCVPKFNASAFSNADNDLIHLFLFLIGFIAWPAWWAGACCIKAVSPIELRFKKYCTIGTVVSVILVIAFFALAIILPIVAHSKKPSY